MGLLDRIQRQGGVTSTHPGAGADPAEPAAEPSPAMARAGGGSGWGQRPPAPPGDPGPALEPPAAAIIPTPGACAVAGCAATLVVPCAYRDRRGELCPSTGCVEHWRTVEGRPYCRRHAGVADTLRLATRRGHQFEAPDLQDRSLTLLRWVASELEGPVVERLSRCGDGRFRTLDDPEPIHVRGDRTRSRPAAWERVWTLADSTGPALRVVLRVEAPRPEAVVLAANHTVLATLVPPWIRHRALGEPEPVPEVDAAERAAFRDQVLAALAAYLEEHPPGRGPAIDLLR